MYYVESAVAVAEFPQCEAVRRATLRDRYKRHRRLLVAKISLSFHSLLFSPDIFTFSAEQSIDNRKLPASRRSAVFRRQRAPSCGKEGRRRLFLKQCYIACRVPNKNMHNFYHSFAIKKPTRYDEIKNFASIANRRCGGFLPLSLSPMKFHGNLRYRGNE